MRAEEFAGFNIALPREKRIEIAAHVAYAGDAIGEQEREQGVLAPGRVGADACEVHMHVPQAGHKEFAASVDDVGRFVKLDSAGSADRGDAACNDDYSLIRLQSAVRSVNDADVLQDKRDVLGGTQNKWTEHYEKEESCQEPQATRPVWATEDHWLHTITPKRLEQKNDSRRGQKIVLDCALSIE